jgi:hypothetical protein
MKIKMVNEMWESRSFHQFAFSCLINIYQFKTERKYLKKKLIYYIFIT